MSSTKLFLAWSLSAAIGLAAASSAAADTLLVDRGLPNANLNNAAGVSQSNVRWAEQPPYFTGDSFSVGAPGPWRIDTLRVWYVAGTGTVTGDPGDFFQNLTLYMGAQGSGVSAVQTGAFTDGTTTDNSDIHITQVHYAANDPVTGDPLTYQAGNDSFKDIWQIDFTNLNLVVNGGDTIEFGVNGDLNSGVNDYFFLHASNAALSGTPQDGSNGLFLTFDSTDLAAGGSPWDSNRSNPQPSGGWNKSSDINVQVFGSQVPEPGSLISAGIAALVLGGVGLRRRRAQG